MKCVDCKREKYIPEGYDTCDDCFEKCEDCTKESLCYRCRKEKIGRQTDSRIDYVRENFK